MAENSGIAWTHHTVNFWIGCEKVSPACQFCYAETWDRRFHPAIAENVKLGVGEHWGSHAPRLLRVEKACQEALRYEKRAAREWRRFRVFTNSMSDFFEDRRDLDAARLGALDVIRRTPHLDWLILTKRPDRVLPLLWKAWEMAADLGNGKLAQWLWMWMGGHEVPANVALGTTVESQEFAAPRLDALLAVPARTHFVSVEPMLGPVDLRRWMHQDWCKWQDAGYCDCQASRRPGEHLDWVIVGGESGRHARSMGSHWPLHVQEACRRANVPFFFKQQSQADWPTSFDNFVLFPDILKTRQFPAAFDYF